MAPTLTPSFREFLPPWPACQPWFTGDAPESVDLVGVHRIEDPAGEVGMETHILLIGATIYQVPVTYRGAPLREGPLIVRAEHSELGPRWIYDGPGDPTWTAAVLGLVNNDAESGLVPPEPGERLLVDLDRVIVPGSGPADDAVGILTGSWRPNGPDAPAVSGRLAVVRRAGAA